MKLLHIDSSILGDNSASRKVTAAITGRLQSLHPGLEEIYRDLNSHPLSHVSLPQLPIDHPIASTSGGPPDSKDVQAARLESHGVLRQFLDADIIVIGAPMYNFTVPSQLKSWIDRILVAGKTFRYGAKGPEGLAGAKRVILAVSRGGIYSAGSAAASAEHVESYLRAVFGFIGIEPEIIVAEGVQMGEESRASSLKAALDAVQALKA